MTAADSTNAPDRGPPRAGAFGFAEGHRMNALITEAGWLGATDVMFLIKGAEKRGPLADAVRPASSLPAAAIMHRPRRSGRVLIFCDRAAAQDINPPP